MEYTKNELLKYLGDCNIEFIEYNHDPLFTVKESVQLRGKIQGAHTKNLFLKDKKKRFYLLSCIEDKKIDLKKLRTTLQTNNLSFASDLNLKEILALAPGSVSPFGLINDTNKITNFYLDKDILNAKTVNFHPLINNSTINLGVDSFMNFIKKINVELQIIDLEVYKFVNNGK